MRIIFVYIILFFCTQSVYSIDLDSFVIKSKIYTVDDGLAANFIQDILQDSSGFIWVATDNGLSRFDGFHFVNFNNENTPAFFNDNRIYRLRLFKNKLYLISTSSGVLELDLTTYDFKLISTKGASDIMRIGKRQVAILFMDGELRYNANGDTTSVKLEASNESGILGLMNQHLVVLLPKVGVFKFSLPSLKLLKQNKAISQSGYHNKLWKNERQELFYTSNMHVWKLDTNLSVSIDTSLVNKNERVSDIIEVSTQKYGILVKQFNTPYLYTLPEKTDLKPLTKQRNQGVRVLLKAKGQDVFFGATSFGLIKYVLSYPGQEFDPTQFPVTLCFYEKERLHEQNIYLVRPTNESIAFESKYENIKLYFTSFNYALSTNEYGFKYKLNGVDISQGFNTYVNIYSLNHGKHVLEVANVTSESGQESVAFYTINSILPFTQTKPFWIMLIIIWVVAGFIILYSITNSLKKEFKIKEALSMDLHDELGTVLTRSYMKVSLMQDMGNKQLSFLETELKTSLHALRTYIALLPQRFIKLSMLVANVKDVLSRFMDKHDMVFSFNFDFSKDITVNNKCYRDVLFCLNEICQSIGPQQALSGCEIQMNVIQFNLEFELVLVKENEEIDPCISEVLLNRLESRFSLTQRGKIIYSQPSPTKEQLILIFNYK